MAQGIRGSLNPQKPYNGNIGKSVGKFLTNPFNVPQDSKGNYKYIRTNRSGIGGTNPAYKHKSKKLNPGALFQAAQKAPKLGQHPRFAEGLKGTKGLKFKKHKKHDVEDEESENDKKFPKKYKKNKKHKSVHLHTKQHHKDMCKTSPAHYKMHHS